MDIDRSVVEALVRTWLQEDIGRGDATTRAVASGRRTVARVEARTDLVVAGVDLACACFEALGSVEWSPHVKDGESAEAGRSLATVDGPSEAVFGAERTALNVLGHLSGIATLTAAYVAAVDGTGVRIADTRKTTPGLRVVEKYAVAVGGGTNHRFGLDDGILIKDNHVAAAGGVAPAVRSAKRSAPFGLKIEVEVSDLAELQEAIDEGADIVLLDNMTPAQVHDALAVVDSRCLVEVSGGISLDNVRDYAIDGVDLISVGALTHSAPTADVALEVV